MSATRITGFFTACLLMVLATAADAAERRSTPHKQTRGMLERLHDRGDHRQEHRRGETRGHGHHRRDGAHHHQRGRDRHLHYGHERWRGGTEHSRHSHHGRGYWSDYHRDPHHHHHRDYRHRVHNNYHYYYNSAGFHFPGLGFIAHGHVHGSHCPHWHFEDFAAALVLGAIIFD